MGDAAAAALYDAMLLDTLARCEAASHTTSTVTRLVVLGAPDTEDQEALRLRVRAPWTLRAQVGADLEARLCHATRTLFAEGHEAVILTGSDAPTLPVHELVAALPWLLEGPRRVVLGPAWDGGYTLLAASHAESRLFEGVAFSTSRTREETLERARATGFETRLLPTCRDVDERDDLAWMERHLAARPEDAPHAARWFSERAKETRG